MGVYIKGVSKEALLQVLGANGIIHNSKDFVEVKEPHGRLIDENLIQGNPLDWWYDEDAVIEAEGE